MADDTIFKEKIKATTQMCKSFYVDFMPIMQKIQYNISIMEVWENKESRDYVLKQINEQVDNAVSLLKQIKKFSENYGEKND